MGYTKDGYDMISNIDVYIYTYEFMNAVQAAVSFEILDHIFPTAKIIMFFVYKYTGSHANALLSMIASWVYDHFSRIGFFNWINTKLVSSR